MKPFRQVLFGVLTAVLSTAIILGSLSLALIESQAGLALKPSPTLPILIVHIPSPTATRIIPTPLPGQPAFTPEPTFTPTLTSTFPPPPTTCPPPRGWSAYRVQPGDTLESVAEQFSTSTKQLAKTNCLLTRSLVAGTVLYVPGPPPTEAPTPCGPPATWVVYLVQPGDTLYYLSQLFNVSVNQLQLANCLGNSTLLRVGQKLYVPNRPTSTPQFRPSSTPRPTKVPSPTRTPWPTGKPTHTPTATKLPNTPKHSRTPTPTRTMKPTKIPTYTATNTPLPTDTPTPTITVTRNP